MLQEQSQTETRRAASERRQTGRNPVRLRYWIQVLLAVGLVAVGGTATVVMFGVGSDTTGPKLTHTITRGDLVVTVIEQGTLESSENTEIKCRVRGYSTVIWVIEGGTVVKPGDELIRLDTKIIEETVSLQKTNAHTARATLERSKADVARSEIAISAYLDGQYRSQMKSLERELAIAESNLQTAEKMLEHSEMLFNRGFVTELEVEGNEFTVTQAKLELEVKKTQIDVLNRFTKEMELETLNGDLIASKSKLEADKAGLAMDERRRDRALEELEYCVIKAEKGGLVIYPSAAAWKDAPDIDEGATVRKDQVLLLMPDLTKMQVKVGIHESVIDRITTGLAARVTLPDQTIDGTVASVAAVTRPAGWWTGNVVKYDTIIQLPSLDGLKPGMSAEVEVVMARHKDVLKIPVAAVVETVEGDFCWVKTNQGFQRRSLSLGDTNDVFVIVQAGLKEGDEVALNPLAFIDEAKTEVVQPGDRKKPTREKTGASDERPPASSAGKSAGAAGTFE